jgi:hypothetical protein
MKAAIRDPYRLQVADHLRLEEHLVAADLMISDHAAVSPYCAALDKQLAYVALDSNLLPNSSLMTIHRELAGKAILAVASHPSPVAA